MTAFNRQFAFFNEIFGDHKYEFLKPHEIQMLHNYLFDIKALFDDFKNAEIFKTSSGYELQPEVSFSFLTEFLTEQPKICANIAKPNSSGKHRFCNLDSMELNDLKREIIDELYDDFNKWIKTLNNKTNVELKFRSKTISGQLCYRCYVEFYTIRFKIQDEVVKFRPIKSAKSIKMIEAYLKEFKNN